MIKTNNQHYVNPFLVSFNSEKYILSSYLNTLCATRFSFFTHAWPQPCGNLIYSYYRLVHSLLVPHVRRNLRLRKLKRKRSPILSQQDLSSCSCSCCADSWTPIPIGLSPISSPPPTSTLVSTLCLASKIFKVSIVRTLPTTPPSNALKK